MGLGFKWFGPTGIGCDGYTQRLNLCDTPLESAQQALPLGNKKRRKKMYRGSGCPLRIQGPVRPSCRDLADFSDIFLTGNDKQRPNLLSKTGD